MASSEKFCLRWNDFESNISVAFRELREDKDFFDVTLACEDNQLSAHKVILSACSPFFRNILRRNPHQHPLLYLRGVKHSDLQSVLNFMYHGEVNVAQEELNSFLAVAEDLKVKGLTQNSSSSATKRARSPAPQITRPPVEREPIKRARPTPAPAPAPPGSYSSVGNDDDDIQEVVESVKQEPREAPVTVLQDNSLVQQQQQSIPQQMTEDDQALAQYSGYDEDYGQYDEPVMEHYDQSAMVGESSESNKDIEDQVSALTMRRGPITWECIDCGKQASQRTDLKRHIEAVHLDLMLPCDICHTIFKTRRHRQVHMRTVHGISTKIA